MKVFQRMGDLDGDGQYEIVVRWYPSTAQDNVFAGYAGSTLLDAYKLDGSGLWRIDLVDVAKHYPGNLALLADATVSGKRIQFSAPAQTITTAVVPSAATDIELGAGIGGEGVYGVRVRQGTEVWSGVVAKPR